MKFVRYRIKEASRINKWETIMVADWVESDADVEWEISIHDIVPIDSPLYRGLDFEFVDKVPEEILLKEMSELQTSITDSMNELGELYDLYEEHHGKGVDG